MDIIPLLAKEMEQEALATRKMLRLVPAENFNWKPHEKSMSQQNLAVHISELPGWVAMGFATSELDFATMDYKPTIVNSNAELLQLFEDSFAKGMAALKNAKEEDLWNTWTMRTGEKIHAILTKYELIRHAFAQTSHHRAQLGVYLRLQHIPIPGTYGPSADDMNF